MSRSALDSRRFGLPGGFLLPGRLLLPGLGMGAAAILLAGLRGLVAWLAGELADPPVPWTVMVAGWLASGGLVAHALRFLARSASDGERDSSSRSSPPSKQTTKPTSHPTSTRQSAAGGADVSAPVDRERADRQRADRQRADRQRADRQRAHGERAHGERAGTARPAFLWLLLTVTALCVWPYALDPERFTVAAFVFWGSWLLFPAALTAWPWRGVRPRRWARVYLRGLAWSAVAFFLVACGVYLARSRPHVGSVDFFFAICNARDMLMDPESASLNAYRYFPGAYVFWRSVMRWAGSSLPVLQYAVIATLIVNAVLCSAVVLRVSRSYLAGVFASVWYLVLASRFQGLTGVMEPLATVPFLVGLLVWGGVPLRGKAGLLRGLGWGACLGITLLVKQQAGLLSLGAVWLLINRRAAPPDRRHEWLALFVLPLAAVAAFLVGVWSEGHGWLPLRQGLRMLSTYPSQGNWLANLYVQFRADESAAVVGLLLLVALVGTLTSSTRRDQYLGLPWLEVAGFCTLAAAATLLQFRVRPYGHYMLLAAPALVVAAVSLAAGALRNFTQAKKPAPADARKHWNEPLRWGLLALAATLPLAHTASNPRTLHVWRVMLPEDFRPQTLWHRQPRVARDLARLRNHVRPGERLYILPPRHQSIQYLLGTRSVEPWGYGFRMPELESMPWRQFDAVLLLTGGLDESDREIWTPERIEQARRSLARERFEVAYRTPTFQLYRPRRSPPEERRQARGVRRRKVSS